MFLGVNMFLAHLRAYFIPYMEKVKKAINNLVDIFSELRGTTFF